MRTSTKKTICLTVGALALLGMLGVVGGMELGNIGVGAGAGWALGLELGGAFCLWKAGALRAAGHTARRSRRGETGNPPSPFGTADRAPLTGAGD